MNPQIERDNALERLRAMIRPESTIYVLFRHKNPLGTARWLEFYVIHDQELKCVTWDVSQAIARTYCRHRDALRITGSGLDAGFATVDELGDALFATGRALKHKWLCAHHAPAQAWAQPCVRERKPQDILRDRHQLPEFL